MCESTFSGIICGFQWYVGRRRSLYVFVFSSTVAPVSNGRIRAAGLDKTKSEVVIKVFFQVSSKLDQKVRLSSNNKNNNTKDVSNRLRLVSSLPLLLPPPPPFPSSSLYINKSGSVPARCKQLHAARAAIRTLGQLPDCHTANSFTSVFQQSSHFVSQTTCSKDSTVEPRAFLVNPVLHTDEEEKESVLHKEEEKEEPGSAQRRRNTEPGSTTQKKTKYRTRFYTQKKNTEPGSTHGRRRYKEPGSIHRSRNTEPGSTHRRYTEPGSTHRRTRNTEPGFTHSRRRNTEPCSTHSRIRNTEPGSTQNRRRNT